jgi:hypothetical protein
MVRFTQRALSFALLTAPAYAADKLAFTCSGTYTPFDGVTPASTVSNETLFIDLEDKTVRGQHLGAGYKIDSVNDKFVEFSSETPVLSKGSFDRYSGQVSVIVYDDNNLTISRSYKLTCKPVKPLF